MDKYLSFQTGVEKREFFVKIKEYAIKRHTETGHMYGSRPYGYHLNMVDDFAQKYSHLENKDDWHIIRAACYTHDLIEDCRETYSSIKELAGEEVAEITYALTNEKGKNRKQRANAKYYNGIIRTKYALFIKLCDRLANVKASHGTSRIKMYRNEHDNFFLTTYNKKYDDMYKELAIYLK